MHFKIGYEANGGFLTNSEFPITAVRDAELPMLAIILLSIKERKPISALLADLPQRFDDPPILHVPESNGTAITVDKVNVSDPFAASDQRGRDVGLFDAHMKQVAQQPHIVGRD